MAAAYTLIPQLAQAIELVEDGTLSRTLFQDQQLKVVLLAFAAGQELTEHTASTPASLHVLEGTCDIGLGGDTVAAEAGTWIHMPARLPHSVKALSPVKLLLMLHKQPATKP